MQCNPPYTRLWYWIIAMLFAPCARSVCSLRYEMEISRRAISSLPLPMPSSTGYISHYQRDRVHKRTHTYTGKLANTHCSLHPYSKNRAFNITQFKILIQFIFHRTTISIYINSSTDTKMKMYKIICILYMHILYSVSLCWYSLYEPYTYIE